MNTNLLGAIVVILYLAWIEFLLIKDLIKVKNSPVPLYKRILVVTAYTALSIWVVVKMW